MTSSALPLLAFGFASPLLLWGLLLGSIPIIIHLLHKRQYRETDWAAMRFLLEAARKHSRRMRLEQLILLAVRVLLFGLLAAALAEPFFESYAALAAAPKPVHRIIVIDASYSMGRQIGDTTCFERAKDAARDVVRSSREGDAFNLVRICGSVPRVVVRQPSHRQEQVIDEIDGLSLTEEPGEFLGTLQDVDVLLGALPETPDKQVTVISDLQRSSWSPEAAGPRAEIQRLLKKIAGEAELTVLDLGQANVANRAVIDLRTNEPFVTAGQEVLVQAAVQNLGPARFDRQTVELHIDDALSHTEQVSLDAGATAVVDFRTRFSRAGEHRIVARIAGDELPIDDHRWLSISAVDSLNILLVNGKSAGRSTDRATYYLETVVSPSTAREPWQGATRSVVVSEGEFSTQDLNRFDCVFLCDMGLFTRPEVEMLQAYVESGGGVIIFPGGQTAAENYNQLLYRDGSGLLPARLGERIKVPESSDDGFRFDLSDLTHPIVRAFEGNPGTGLESAITLEYFRTNVPAESQARVAMRFQSGDPAVVEKIVGLGRAILVTTSADIEWGTWPVVRSFPPVVHEMIRYAVSGRRAERRLLVGSAITKTYAVHGASGAAIVTLPDGRQETVPLSESNSRAKLTFDSTNRSGIYSVALQGSGNPAELFAVNVDSHESDLAKVTEHELESEVLSQTPFNYRTRSDELPREEAGVDSEQGGLSRWLLVAAFALLFVEQLMAWRFSYGFLLLCAVVIGSLLWQATAWQREWGLLVTLFAIAGIGILAIVLFRRIRGSFSQKPSFRNR